jgi:hypothetical protein
MTETLQRAVCPRCRRVGRTEQTCDLDGARLLDLEVDQDREELLAAIWGSPDQRELLEKQLGQALGRPGQRIAVAGAFGALSAVVYSFVGSSASSIGLFAWGCIGAIAAAAFPKRRISTFVPAQATPLPSLPRYAAGRLLSTASIGAPASAETCAAWAVELRYEGPWPVRHTLRIGASAGCEVELDGGERLRIPAGPLWIDGKLVQIDAEPSAVDDMLDDLDPQRRANDHFPLFPYNVVLEQLLHHGDRVEVLGEIERVPDPTAADEMYRDAAPSILRPRGVPVLRRL